MATFLTPDESGMWILDSTRSYYPLRLNRADVYGETPQSFSGDSLLANRTYHWGLELFYMFFIIFSSLRAKRSSLAKTGGLEAVSSRRFNLPNNSSVQLLLDVSKQLRGSNGTSLASDVMRLSPCYHDLQWTQVPPLLNNVNYGKSNSCL